MCGITGVSYDNTNNNIIDIQKMSDAISHRGPDGEGFLAINSILGKVTELAGVKTPVQLPRLSDFTEGADIYLAHRRLSIIDTSKAGHQPMANAKKNIWLTYNGEIYNYKSLKNEFSDYSFVSNTDTEVLLCAYEKWGVDCLKYLNGMWAFVIYDARKNILFGARDRFGVKPLYYAQVSNFFAFNSEIKGLLAKPGFSRKVNMNASGSFLNDGSTVFGEETFFEEILELLPAHYFIYDISKRELSVEKYYELTFQDEWETFDERKSREYLEETKRRVMKSVELRLNADVTVGSCLSGGLDSSSIVCSIHEILKQKNYSAVGSKQGVVTACYNNLPIDESKWAKEVVDYVNADWHKVFPKREELEVDLYDLIYSQDVPFQTTSIYAQYRVMKSAREAGLKVMLDGQGGDELFTGYLPYYNMFFMEAKKNRDRVLLRNEQAHIDNTPFPLNTNFISNWKFSPSINEIKKFIPRSIKQKIKKIIGIEITSPKCIYIKNKQYKQYKYTTLNQMLYFFMTYYSLPQLLKFEDRNSMRFSIESRTPFADDIELIEYIFSIPGVYKIHNGWSKYLLRESMSGIVPDIIKTRTDKIGFETPEYDWLKSIKAHIFPDYDPSLNEIINMPLFEDMLDDLSRKSNKKGYTDIWRYINYTLWFKIFKATI